MHYLNYEDVPLSGLVALKISLLNVNILQYTGIVIELNGSLPSPWTLPYLLQNRSVILIRVRGI